MRYTDLDGRETTVIIIHANTGWEKLVGGSHVAIHFSNPGIDSYGEITLPSLYDPSGSYEGLEQGKYQYRPSSGLFSGEHQANLDIYINSVLERDNVEYLVTYSINTTPKQEASMIEKSIELGAGYGFSCANYVSQVLTELGFKPTLMPGNLEKQLKDSELIEEILIYKKELE